MSQFIEMFGNPLASVQKYQIRSLFDCCEINPRRPLLNILDSDLVSFVPMSSVNENGFLQDLVDEEYGKVKKGFTYFENNDVLFAKITPCMENGKGAIAHSLTNGIGMGSTEFHVLRPIKNISNPYWLLCLTRMPIFRDMAAKNMSGTGGQKRVGSEYMSNFKVGLPPIDLQIKFAELYQQADKSKFIGFKSQFIEMIKNTTSQRKKIHEIAKVQTGSTPSKNRQEYWYNGNHPWVSAQDMIDKYVEDTIEKVTNAGYATCKVIPAGSVLYVCRGSIGVISINKMDCATNQSICTATCLNNCRNEFLYYSLKYSEKDIKQQGTGTSFKSLNQSSFSSIEIDVPSLDKQNTFIEIAQQADKSKYIN